ncbi:unnamed protein product [Phyllotreta striolata]|uniref:Saposin B-type domain-containing protein n=1 Tax=Phyllotreta striolata TaxID=444603 RepID=A0A9N9TM39_PHYSR|nr:unnamed protein product [Phyllotreta striolata]
MKCTLLLAVFCLATNIIYASATDTCDNCMTIVDLAVDVLSIGISDEQITAMGDFACKMFPFYVRPMCPLFYNVIYSIVYDMLMVQQISSTELCSISLLCPASTFCQENKGYYKFPLTDVICEKIENGEL